MCVFQQKNVNYFETKKPPVTNKRCIFAKHKLKKNKNFYRGRRKPYRVGNIKNI